jgi:iron complex transport system substrate-binding protein
MKACSFLPAVTQMIYDMDLQDYLHGVTFECPANALKEKPKLVRCVLEDKQYSSAEIDKIFSASKALGRSLYYVDEELLQQIQPDIIFTQDVCEICQIDSQCTAAAVSKLKKKPRLISISPRSLDDVYDSAITIAAAFAKEENAYAYCGLLKKRTDVILDRLRSHQIPLKRTLLLEWIDPLYNCGHWIPFQIALAGGIDMLSNPAGDSIVTPWEKIVRYDPQILLIAPCGFETKRTGQEMCWLSQKPGWSNIQAVRTKRVFLADYDLFTQPSASTLTDGIELLAALFHPELFDVPEKLKNKYLSFYKITDDVHART